MAHASFTTSIGQRTAALIADRIEAEYGIDHGNLIGIAEDGVSFDLSHGGDGLISVTFVGYVTREQYDRITAPAGEATQQWAVRLGGSEAGHVMPDRFDTVAQAKAWLDRVLRTMGCRQDTRWTEATIVQAPQQERVRHGFTSVATGSVEGGTVRVVRDDTGKPRTEAWQDPAWGPRV